MVLQQRNDDIGRHSTQNLSKSFHEEVNLAAGVAGNRTPNDTNGKVCNCDNSRKDEGEACTVGKTCKNILACFSGTEQEERLLNAVLQNLAMAIGIVFIVLSSNLNTAINLTAIGIEVLLTAAFFILRRDAGSGA